MGNSDGVGCLREVIWGPGGGELGLLGVELYSVKWVVVCVKGLHRADKDSAIGCDTGGGGLEHGSNTWVTSHHVGSESSGVVIVGQSGISQEGDIVRRDCRPESGVRNAAIEAKGEGCVDLNGGHVCEHLELWIGF